ncbi:putative metal-binding protein [Desulfosporosinus orientis DSM 765]|uniref:Putative metal-binding protein n=1 Tax=Desulfosporosinus orientis (strain ATCC 19365 / DSM 765 / NCIMB 8382 / VKM B-1628 / Singapore I) TaxID=768706 RepID=G7W632_DESOD|nr:ASKHA domain-containing protein [Desulfosporosinus orientis]AET67694.1 putative metal-binding protein [Desulfosporosinus orientis DSM 765]
MKYVNIIFQPGSIGIQVETGTTIMKAMNQAELRADFPCGGVGKCGKCRVKVLAGSGELTASEKDRLTIQEQEEGIRLACLAEIHENMIVELLSPQQLQHHILMDALDRPFYLNANVIKQFVEVKEPSLSNHKSDWQRLKDALAIYGYAEHQLQVCLPILRQLPETIKQGEGKLTAVLLGLEVVGVEAGDTSANLWGMAFDIGTTTIVGYLMDLISGKELIAVSTLNPQAQYGGDVISRITFAGNREGMERLHRAVTVAVNGLIGEAVERVGGKRENLYAISIAANTTMHHLFLGVNPRSIGVSPYVSAFNQGLVVNAFELGLEINRAGQVYALPNIAGFVGADTTAVLLASEPEKRDYVTLILDIGTNGEIVLASNKKMVACSAAAGPAFEGAQITNGMRGAIGAIDHISFGENMEFSVIGGGKPAGICGSALLDGVAGFVELGMINKRGKFLEPDELTKTHSLRFKERLIEYDGAWAFLIADAVETVHGRPIMITQNDIRELQLAKGAIMAGVKILMETSGSQFDDVKEVLLAGAFGNYLNPHSACVIGLIPKELEGKIRMIGNAAGTGAKIALLSADEFSRADNLADSVSFIELGSYSKFNRIFAENTYFQLD